MDVEYFGTGCAGAVEHPLDFGSRPSRGQPVVEGVTELAAGGSAGACDDTECVLRLDGGPFDSLGLGRARRHA